MGRIPILAYEKSNEINNFATSSGPTITVQYQLVMAILALKWANSDTLCSRAQFPESRHSVISWRLEPAFDPMQGIHMRL